MAPRTSRMFIKKKSEIIIQLGGVSTSPSCGVRLPHTEARRSLVAAQTEYIGVSTYLVPGYPPPRQRDHWGPKGDILVLLVLLEAEL